VSLAPSHEPTVERHQTEQFFVNPITFSTFPIPTVSRISVVHTIFIIANTHMPCRFVFYIIE